MVQEGIPRMRTAANIVAEIRALDPNTEVTEFYIRQLIKRGGVPVVRAGRKMLINLDDVLALLRIGDTPPKADTAPTPGIRRINP